MNNKRVNSAIRSNKVMVIGNEGQQYGILPTHIAISKAKNQGLDLVEVSDKSNPPVCKMMDYGKYQFDQRKIEKKQKAKNKVHLKEIRMKTVIANNDLTTKVKKCIDFLTKGNKVKISISTHPRRHNDKDVAMNMMETISEILGDFGTISAKPKLDGRFLNAFFTPI
jgi:translation initiation factor IF-3